MNVTPALFHQHVEPIVPSREFVGEALHGLQVRQVDWQDLRAPLRLHPRQPLAGLFSGDSVPARQDRVGVLVGENASRFEADTAVRTRHDDDAAPEVGNIRGRPSAPILHDASPASSRGNAPPSCRFTPGSNGPLVSSPSSAMHIPRLHSGQKPIDRCHGVERIVFRHFGDGTLDMIGIMTYFFSV